MSFVNTLPQNIAIFNGNDSSQLEDWFIDIETASDLTGESRTTLAQAKPKGLIHTLISEALSSTKPGMKLRITSIYKSAIQTSIHLSIILWKSNKRKRNL